MTHQPEPIRKSNLPTIPPPEWEFFTFFPYPDDEGGDMVRGQRQRGVQVRRLVTYGDWEPVRPDRWADEPETAAVSAAVAPPTDDTHGLSVPHADALWDAIATPGPDRPTYPEQHERVCRAVREILDELTPAPAEPADRAAVLRWAADHLDTSERLRDLTDDHMLDIHAAANELRRMADETQPAEPQPRRGDQFEAWLKTQRDENRDSDRGQWSVLDNLLDLYRLHADTDTPLGEHVCEGQAVGDCECLEQPASQAQKDGAQQ